MRPDLRRATRLVEALRSERGFTLAELLVACVVVAFVMAGLFITLQSGQEVYLRGSNQVELHVAPGEVAPELHLFLPPGTPMPHHYYKFGPTPDNQPQ